jgi:hypothetical protein
MSYQKKPESNTLKSTETPAVWIWVIAWADDSPPLD